MMLTAEEIAEVLADAAADETVTPEMRWRVELRMRRHFGLFPFRPRRSVMLRRRGSVLVTSNIPTFDVLFNFERDLLLPHVAQLVQGLYSVDDGL